MKRLLVLAALVAVALVPMAAQAAPSYPGTGDQVKLLSNTGANGGGEFNFDIAPFDSITNFTTFCLELTEHISGGTPYFVKVATFADTGGDAAHGGPNDPLDFKTAFLYSGFVAGTLPGTYSQNAFQAAVWKLEQEVDGLYTGLSLSAAEITQADAYIAAATAAAWTDLGRVRVAQLWTNADFTGHAQDVLTIPEPGSMMLLGMGLLGLAGAVRRRVRK